MQADTIGRQVVCSKMTEIRLVFDIVNCLKVKCCSGLGAALAGGIGAHQITLNEFSESDSPKLIRYTAKLDEETRTTELKQWKKAVSRAMDWASY